MRDGRIEINRDHSLLIHLCQETFSFYSRLFASVLMSEPSFDFQI